VRCIGWSMPGAQRAAGERLAQYPLLLDELLDVRDRRRLPDREASCAEACDGRTGRRRCGPKLRCAYSTNGGRR
jgi:hypothetical protein